MNWGRYLAYKPNLTILVIGGNDIKPASKPVEIARAIIQLGKRIELETGGKVKILTIERRPVPVGVSAISYNRQRTSINRYLKHRDEFTWGKLIFSEAQDGDSQDGVHLRERAMTDLAHKLVWHMERFVESVNF